MSDEIQFFSFLLEEYADYKNLTAPEVLKIWDETVLFAKMTLTEYILEKYFIYHIEALENAFKDIDHLLATGKPLY